MPQKLMTEVLTMTACEETTSAPVELIAGLTTHILTGPTAIQGVKSEIHKLLIETGQSDEVTLTPEYFQERNELQCAPVLVLLERAGRLHAVLYGRERRIAGIRTGLVQFGDYYGDGAVIAPEQIRAQVVAAGVSNVLKLRRVHTVRASFKAVGAEDEITMERLLRSSKLHIELMPEPVQHNLALGDSFDGFLGTLGSHTRRNLRVYRRRVEQKGWQFVGTLNPQEVDAAFAALKKQQVVHESTERYISCCRAVLEAVPRAAFAGLRDETGEWVSVVAGWVRNGRYFMLVQLNDGRRTKDSVSIVMRSYLIQQLIESGVRDLTFVGGSSEMLRRFCVPQRCLHYLIEKNDPLRMFRRYAAQRLFKTSMWSRIAQRNERGEGSGSGEEA